MIPADGRRRRRHFRLVADGRLLVALLVLTMSVLVLVQVQIVLLVLLEVFAFDLRRCVWQEEIWLMIRVIRDLR